MRHVDSIEITVFMTTAAGAMIISTPAAKARSKPSFPVTYDLPPYRDFGYLAPSFGLSPPRPLVQDP